MGQMPGAMSAAGSVRCQRAFKPGIEDHSLTAFDGRIRKSRYIKKGCPRWVPISLPFGTGLTSLLRSWRLFGLLALLISIVNGFVLATIDLTSRRGAEQIVVLSVRYALPLFFIVFTASSLATLWPTRLTRWLLLHRRYLGLSFAFAMGWHFSFVAYYLITFRPQLSPRGVEADVVGLAFLVAMTLTSFRPVARHLSRTNWRRLHKGGIYAIWLLILYIYQGGARSQGDSYHLTLVALLAGAWLLRMLAWMRVRRSRQSVTRVVPASGS